MTSHRRPIAVVVSRFPLVTETFILRELIELERQGQGVVLVPLLREVPEVVHDEARSWVDRAWYTPYLSPAIVTANLRAAAAQPARYFGTLAALVAGCLASPTMLVKTLAIFPKSVFLAERLAAAGIAHVHAHFATHPATAAYVIARLSSITFSITVHAHDIFVNRALLGRKLAGAAFVRAISGFNRDYLVRRYPAVGDQLRVIHTGVESQLYPRREDVPIGPPLILSIAALKPYKGLPVLIDACAQLRRHGVSFRCVIAGAGPDHRALASRIAEHDLGAMVALIGARRQDEIRMLLDQATVVALPSIVAADGQVDGIPVALMEAMAAGVPVIASRVSGIPELVVDGRNGLLVKQGDVDDLASTLERLLADPELQRRMGTAGAEDVARSFELRDNVAALVKELDACHPPLTLANEVAAAIARTAPDAAVVAQRHAGDSSVVHVRSTTQDLIVKQHGVVVSDERSAAERAQREYDILDALACARSTGVAVDAPDPVWLDAPAAVVVMSHCRGVALTALIGLGSASRRHDRSGMLAAIASVGTWLRAFHRVDVKVVKYDNPIQRLRQQVERDLEICLSRSLLRRGGTGILQQTEALIERFAPPSRRAVLRHGDLWPGNVFVSDTGVQVVDFEATRIGTPWEDAAYFLLHLELYFVLAAPRTRRSVRGRFLDAFCGGHVDSAALELATLAAALQSLAHGRQGHRGSWHRLVTTAVMTRVISRAAARGADAQRRWAPSEAK